MTLCPCSDDKGVKCQNTMTEKEKKQDGMCCRCADLIWGWHQQDTPVIYKNPHTREF
jgi:hypothetical protein